MKNNEYMNVYCLKELSNIKLISIKQLINLLVSYFIVQIYK